MDNQPDVIADPHRPEILVLRLVQLMELHPRIRRVHLEVERRRLDRLLFLACKAREAVGEGIGDAEFHTLTLIFHY